MERTTTLEASPNSVRAARRFLAEVLADWGLAGVVETAELLVSELVTNVVLHAHTDIVVKIRRHEVSVHVEVCDTSNALPTISSHHRESQTGRGLELVEVLADAWGVDVHRGRRGIDGKSVWFDLSVIRPPASAERLAAPGSSTKAHISTVCLEGVPTALYRASEEHRQGLTREFALMTINADDGPDVPSRLVALSEELSQRFARESANAREQVQAAELRGDANVNLLLELPPGSTAALEAIVDLLEEADRFCEHGAMLTVPATAEVRAFRRWCVDDVAAQLAGRDATPWSSR